MASSLTISVIAAVGLYINEGLNLNPHIPTKGDVPTIGFGSTVYEDGTRVKLTDPPINFVRAIQIAQAHTSKDAKFLVDVLDGIPLYQHEYDAYMNFIYQFGQANFRNSTMHKELLKRNYIAACNGLLKYKYQNKRDCSDPIDGQWGSKNGCKGVWLRQLERHQICLTGKYPDNWKVKLNGYY